MNILMLALPATRYFLPLYMLAYVSVAFVWRSYAVWKRTGVNPIVFKGSDSAHDFIGRVSKALLAVVIGVVLIHSFIPSAYPYLMPIVQLERTWVSWTGAILLLLSFLWTVLAQVQMGNSWRIGIDNEHRTKLVQTGVFTLSRNPIFVGLTVTLFGLFLMIPNAATLVILLLGVILMGIQVRLEEEYLIKLHGDDYLQYRRRVRRWL